MRAAGAKLAVVVIPDEIQVDAKKRAEVFRRFNLDEKDFDLDEFQKRVAALCASEKVPCVDVLPAFRENGSDGGLYLDLDTHWNAKGHALAASPRPHARGAPQMSRLDRGLRLGAAVLVVTIVALAGAEGVARISWRRRPRPTCTTRSSGRAGRPTTPSIGSRSTSRRSSSRSRSIRSASAASA